MKVIDLLNKIARGEIKDKTIFRINWGHIYRDFYYDASEENQLQCLKNCSDNYSLYDDIKLNDEIEIIEDIPKDNKKIEDKARFQYSEIPNWLDIKEVIRVVNSNFERHQKALSEIIDKINGE